MGKGAFANQLIPRGTIIGEYLGRLHPLMTLHGGDRYIFYFNEAADVSAYQYGNITRFVNHHCKPNITAQLVMYGRRRVIVYTANQDIQTGDQVFVSYGRGYFEYSKTWCKCDNVEGNHLPSAPQPAWAQDMET
ncbi:hypothetical protein J7T55_007676 [Diaporthe amygdali]|uniref:uncharacterized protein n=1 Tax=Phomopsis amygdali TaxID=1214568 RepID=UPI0022FE61D4|nr:uncharacterized protein J7T55_007676 [Diaporthe amygdali]KAJ0107487.1 hypothetical protein J7T55_007676 [Diaporthe amygdali]